MDQYASSSYDEHFCLKPPAFLWFALIYLSRAISLPAVVAIGSYAGVDPAAIALCRELWSANALVPSVFAVAVLVALCRRAPKASAIVRWIWTRGRVLLILAAAIDLAFALFEALQPREFGSPSLMPFIGIAIDVALIVYFVVARRARDSFKDFPARPEESH
jgi:Protein of unknown function (DUF2919)